MQTKLPYQPSYAEIRALKCPWTVSTFPPGRESFAGCMRMSDFYSRINDGVSVLPGVGVLPLTIVSGDEMPMLMMLASFSIPIERLEIHVRLDKSTALDKTFCISGLCRAIRLFVPRVSGMSTTIPHTIGDSAFDRLSTAWILALEERSAKEESNLSSSNAGDSLSVSARSQHMASLALFQSSRWPSKRVVLATAGDFASLDPLVRMINFGAADGMCVIKERAVLEQLVKFLKESSSDVKPNVAVRCYTRTARSLHAMLAGLWPRCASLWVLMEDTIAGDAVLSDLMLCDESCHHEPLDSERRALCLTGIVLSQCSGLTDSATTMLQNVERVDISDCRQISSAGFARLGHCTDVVAHNTSLRDEDLHLFAKATTLDISRSLVTPGALSMLSDVRAIRTSFLVDELQNYPNAWVDQQ